MQKPKFVTQLELNARKRRFWFLTQLLKPLQRPIRILDVGGEFPFWEKLDYTQLGEIHVTMLNLFPQKALPPNFCSHVGDARSMPAYASNDFDVVVSNSVISLVGGYHDQESMASEIRRIGKKYFLQTPNCYFPVDWRTLVPFFHFLPLKFRAHLVHSFPIAPIGRLDSYSSALQWVSRVRDLSRREIQALFPEATIAREKALGFTKSYIVVHGFDTSSISMIVK